MKLTLKVVLALECLALAGCMSLPGHVETSTSKFDGERQVQVDPGWLLNGMSTTVKLGGFWTDKAPDRFMLSVAYWGTKDIEAVKVRIDSEVVDLKPSGPTQFYTAYNNPESSRRFGVPLAFIYKLMDGKEVMFQVSLSSGSFVEGTFSTDRSTSARPAFRKALFKISEIQPDKVAVR